MRLFIYSFEAFLLILLSFVVIQSEKDLLQSLIKDELKKNDINVKKVIWKKIDSFEFKDISYKKRKISKNIFLDIDYLSFLNGYIGFDSMIIDSLQIDNLLKIKQKNRKKSNKLFPIPISIYNLTIDAKYIRKKESINIYTKIENIKIFKNISASVEKMSIDSIYAKIRAKGFIKNLKLTLFGSAIPNKKYLSKFVNEFDLGKIDKIDFKTVIDTQKIDFVLTTSAKDFLKKFKTSVLKSTLKGVYLYKEKELKSNLLTNVGCKNTKALIEAKIFYKNDLKYRGNAKIVNLPKLTKELNPKLFEQVDINFSGNLQKTKLKLYNNYLEALANIEKNKSEIIFSLNTKKIYFTNLIRTDTQLKKIFLYLNLYGTYKKNLNINYHIKSNLVDIIGTYKNRRLNAQLLLSFSSLLKRKGFKVEKLFPLKVTSNTYLPLNVKFSNNILNGDLVYSKKQIDSKIFLKDTQISVYGNPLEKLSIDLEVDSLKSLNTELEKIYPINIKNIDARLKAKILFDMKNYHYEANIVSPRIIYEYEKDRFYTLTYFNTNLRGDLKKIIIDYYAFAFKEYGIYATKSSEIVFDKSKILIKKLWIEDKVKIDGLYELNKEGRFNINAKSYKYSSVEGVIDFDLELIVYIKNKNIFTEGKVFINSATITHNPKKIRTIKDKDIIIVDIPEVKKSLFFKKNIALNIHIISKKAFFYKIKDMKAQLFSDLTIWKEYQKDLELLGQIVVEKGKYYFGEKMFKITKSEVDFYGPITNPFININVKYEKEPYIIYIKIVGEFENPIITFDSEPFLSQNDILAMIIFDSKLSSLLFKTTGGEKFAEMLSNFFVKDLIKNFGLKLDKYSLITSGSGIGFEIGKKISDKITVLYKNDQISSIIIRYKINRYLQSEVFITPQKSAFDLYYKIEK
ncbi:translocation/assembly module TamB domain-containing protein [Nitrosophilus labii]|uniref:translocation/assembly module TamB domain-containing protein n=1 Tax=Nitrosophilus labii TaxID=2706014 RepID=UPI0016570110|nr:translocation/assembly module TamB domain-containing protein [Nitrosophilus labii]